MSSPQRKAELRQLFLDSLEAEEVEAQRVANLSDYERIEEIDNFRAVKDFLHILVERMKDTDA
jgi:hypothetical protein